MGITGKQIELIRIFNNHICSLDIKPVHRMMISYVIRRINKGIFVTLSPEDSKLLNEVREVYIKQILKK